MLAWAVDGEERLPTLFLVDKDSPGVEMTADPDFTHNFPYRHPEFTFTKTPVPRENILGERGRGFELTASGSSRSASTSPPAASAPATG